MNTAPATKDIPIVRPPATALIIFGATGDLTHRKLVPALYNLAADDYLPEEFIVIGSARTKLSDQEFRDKMRDAVQKFSRQPLTEEVWNRFAKNLYYQPVNGTKLEDFAALKERLDVLGNERKRLFNYAYYLAMAPNFFGDIASNLKAAGLVEPVKKGSRSTIVVIEKPFGHDLASAQELNKVLRQSFAEEQIYRIDHYLGKETVQNILVFRFANGIFEPLWNHKYIDHIQITCAESIGVGSRAAYFDSSGILRDIVQNHLLQVLSLLCIEPPISLTDADSIRNEKVKVLRSIKRYSLEEVATQTVRGQYLAGTVGDEQAIGYLQESGVAEQSKTDTYVALKLEIDNWRWSGIPIYLRAGKRLPKRTTEIAVYFKQAPASLFRGREKIHIEQNVINIRVQPQEGISLNISSKPPGPRLDVKSVEMDFTYDASFGTASPEAYERLLLDAMKGDATLFIRNDEIEEAWDLLAPILNAWDSANPPPVCQYQAGTWGPTESAQLLKSSNHQWRRL
jgi:glucose-6-phosphate 1-dehydrogenase